MTFLPWQRLALCLVAQIVASLALLELIDPSAVPSRAVRWEGEDSLLLLHLAGSLLAAVGCSVLPALVIYIMKAGHLTSRLTFHQLFIAGTILISAVGQAFLLDGLEHWYAIQWARGIVKVEVGILAIVATVRLVRNRQQIIEIALAIDKATRDEQQS